MGVYGYVLGISPFKGLNFMVHVGKHGAYGYRSESFFFRLFHEML